MENDQVLEAEARLYRPPDSSPPPYPINHEEHLGRDAIKVAHGGIEVMEDEETPLLSSDDDARLDTVRSIPEESNSRPPPLWSGERDFDGLPWWKRPSVRTKHTISRNAILTFNTTGLLVDAPLSNIYPRLWGNNRPKAQSHRLFNM